MELLVNQIIYGSALEVLKTFPAESINCCISSPPYWALRDYGVEGQLGLESTFEEYIDKLCTVYDEVKRVLRKDGTCWVNLGDTYGTTSGGMEQLKKMGKNTPQYGAIPYADGYEGVSQVGKRNINMEKCLCLIPERFAIEMVNRGWILRNVIIWHKPNPMPSSAKDRFTVDFEYVYFFVKSKKYWFEPQYEPQLKTRQAGTQNQKQKGKDEYQVKSWERTECFFNPLGRNKRCVWTITTQPCPEAHFATFPDKLVEPMIKAGCPEFVCKKCGKAREKIYERIGGPPKGSHTKNFACRDNPQNRPNGGAGPYGADLSRIYTEYGYAENKFMGYTDCGCNAGWRPGAMLDPFCGTGTACAVAAQLGRDYIGIDLKQEYVMQFAVPKIKAAETGVPVAEQKQGQGSLFE